MTVHESVRAFSSTAARRAFVRRFAAEGLLPYDYQSLDGNIQTLYHTPQRSAYLLIAEYLQMSGSAVRATDCVVEYVRHDVLQAYATSDGGFHHVAVTHALPLLFQILFQTLLRDTSPFDGRAAKQPLDVAFPDSLTELPGEEGAPLDAAALLAGTMPAERWQKIVATRLSEIAVLFCFCHELSHLVWGHTALAARRGAWGLHEIEGSTRATRRPVSHALSQTWEIQADRHATAFLIGYGFNNAAYRQRLARHLLCRGAGASREQLLERMVYAISFVFFLFGQRQRDVASPGTHPSALTRQTFLLANIVVQFMRKYPDADEEAITLATQWAATVAERAWNRLGFAFGEYDDRIEALGGVVQRLARHDALAARLLRRHQWLAREAR